MSKVLIIVYDWVILILNLSILAVWMVVSFFIFVFITCIIRGNMGLLSFHPTQWKHFLLLSLCKKIGEQRQRAWCSDPSTLLGYVVPKLHSQSVSSCSSGQKRQRQHGVLWKIFCRILAEWSCRTYIASINSDFMIHKIWQINTWAFLFHTFWWEFK